MANKPYQEGAVWSFRLRIKDQSIYRTGFVSADEARREVERLRQKILEAGKPKHAGPWRTTLAQAMQQYALERLPSLKGARQEANRINCYLRAANLDIIKIAKPLSEAAVVPGIYWDVSLAPGKQPRKIPNGLHAHRRRQEDGSIETQRLIRHLAKTPMAQIMTYQAQDLVDVMLREGYEPATITLERALLRQMFNYARKT
ncbi:MAG TPA: hypothetical protein VGK09_06585 [Rhodocyclaceae bacterium]